MKLTSLKMALVLAATLAAGTGQAFDEQPVLEGPYLGQTPPGMVPEVFAPGIVSKENRDNSGFFTPDMKAFYFTRKDGEDAEWTLVSFTLENNRWRESVVMPRVGRPLIAPDGRTMHLGKHYMVRTAEGWSEVKSYGPEFDKFRVMRLTSSRRGMFVIDEVGPGGTGLLRYSEITGGKREAPKAFGKEINTGEWNAHPFLAPDESYLIWDGERESGQGNGDLYISFRNPDGSWGEAINMGDAVNTEASESGASVSPDGKYLFFNRNVGSPAYENIDIFWVDAKIIDELRPE